MKLKISTEEDDFHNPVPSNILIGTPPFANDLSVENSRHIAPIGLN